MKMMCYRCMQESVENGVCTVCGSPMVQRAENSDLLPLGTLLDNGSIIVGDKLGSGGFGITYVARDANLGIIALKEFVPRHMLIGGRDGLSIRIQPDKQQMYQKSLASFYRESRILSLMQHPHIVRVLFSMTENNTAYYGMEFLRGVHLGKYITQKGTMNARDAFLILLPIMSALEYVHNMNILHRDLSPDNIFLRTSPQSQFGVSPCLIDFGAAYAARDDFTHSMPRVKKSGYSPLEQNWPREYQGPFTDVYAFAATYYYMLTGTVPTPALDRATEEMPLPSQINPSIPAAVDQVILHAMAIKPADRIQNIPQFRAELANALGIQIAAPRQAPVTPPPVTPPPVPKPMPDDIHVQPPMPDPDPEPIPEPDPIPFQNGGIDSEPVSTRMQDVIPGVGRSGAHFGALMLDHLILGLLPLILGILILEDMKLIGAIAGAFVGMLLMLFVNTLLCAMSKQATLSQRIFGWVIKSDNNQRVEFADNLIYNLLRSISVFSVVDELLVLMGAYRQPLIEKCGHLFTMRASAAENAAAYGQTNNASNSSYVNRPSSEQPPKQERRGVMRAVLHCKTGIYAGKTIDIGRLQTFGRDASASVRFPNTNRVISTRHCMVEFNGRGWVIRDMNSSNGTYLNKVKIPKGGTSRQLANGDVMKIGEETFVFEIM